MTTENLLQESKFLKGSSVLSCLSRSSCKVGTVNKGWCFCGLNMPCFEVLVTGLAWITRWGSENRSLCMRSYSSSAGCGREGSESWLNSVWVDKCCWCWELALASNEAGITPVPQGFRPLAAAHGPGLCAVRAPAWSWKSSLGNSGFASQVASARICLQYAQASCSKHKKLLVVLLDSNCFGCCGNKMLRNK